VRLAEPIDVVAYVRRLEQLMIDAIAELGVRGERVEGRSGVWLRGTEKIGAIGVRVSQGVATHGFALNCSNAFDAYEAIIACGLPDASVTSVSRELGREVPPRDIAPLIRDRFETVVGPVLAGAAVPT